MCEKTKRRIDRASILYKIFLITMIITQVIPMALGVLFWPQLLIHITLIIYLSFRYYMLVRMKKRAIKDDLTLTEFLQERENCKND